MDQPLAICSVFPAVKPAQIRPQKAILLSCKIALSNSVPFAGPFMHCTSFLYSTESWIWNYDPAFEGPLK